jgi:hypothetical protein
MNQELAQYFHEHLYTIILIQVVLSLVFGAIVLLVGMKRGKRRLGLIGAVVSFIVGVLSPVLGLISAAVFVSIIVVKTGKGGDTELPGSHTS